MVLVGEDIHVSTIVSRDLRSLQKLEVTRKSSLSYVEALFLKKV